MRAIEQIAQHFTRRFHAISTQSAAVSKQALLALLARSAALIRSLARSSALIRSLAGRH